MNKTVLITGGSGLIGKPLTKALLDRGYQVRHLSRSANNTIEGVEVFRWDVGKGEIDPDSINGVNAIIHLAGEGIAARPWRNEQKRELISSRVDSIRLLYKLLRESSGSTVDTVISASGVGYYGNRGDEELAETSSAGEDFMAECCIKWENAVDEIKSASVRTVKLRTGVVLTAKGGALDKMAQPIRLGLGAALGSGKQWMPWIHINDLVSMYLFALENNSLSGCFNAASPYPETNAIFTRKLANALHKSFWLPAVPAFVLRIILGEMAAVVLNSTKTHTEKIQTSGFRFTFGDLSEAFNDIYGNKATS